ncbi:NAD-dependent epimerase/dehydratase family protein [Aeromicrobium sp. Root472D3]|uniref:NAD-dependent epimerase/dehydratase family protein n=1 Tax=Aeromicrobium sp. Root472D3 TaxID=1736540 RepID=UPI00191084C0|nr:NAD-dependent epimerase/dehydratase family protein [Aeromicrobium sp. Root472D3]
MAAVLMAADTLLVGCGELGADIGLRLAARGHEVVAIRRRAELVPAPLRGLSADLTRELPDLPPLDLTHLVVALTARPRSEESYRATYVDGMARALDALEAAGQVPRRAVLVSSTAVLGDSDPGALLDESSPCRPTDGPGRMLLEAEQLFAARVPGGTVLRLSGLYGHGEPRLVDQVRRGEVTDPHRWTNRIHRDDAAAAAVHLLTRDDAPAPLYLGTDDEPSLLGDVAAFVAGRIDAPAPPPADPALGHGKRLDNGLLRASGWVPTYPTYREGYGAQL